MYTFFTQLPKISHTVYGRNKRLVLSIHPCQDVGGEKVWYRFRLLAFCSPEKNSRDYPFIERYVHQKWTTSENGLRTLEKEVVCPSTSWVEMGGDKKKTCPICRLANQYFLSYKDSGWKDSTARLNYINIKRKYEAIIPVWVVNDPNYPNNNGRMKVIIFTSPDLYHDFRNCILLESQTHHVFNATQAVDCCIHMVESSVTYNKGTDKEKTYPTKKIDRLVFSTKPYDITGITTSAINDFPFDDEYYTSSTMDELKEFYTKYIIGSSNNDINDIPKNYEKNDIPKEQSQTTSNPSTNDDLKSAEDLNDEVLSLINDIPDFETEPKKESPAPQNIETKTSSPKKDDSEIPEEEEPIEEKALDDLIDELYEPDDELNVEDIL